jgi:hypothetical protein
MAIRMMTDPTQPALSQNDHQPPVPRFLSTGAGMHSRHCCGRGNHTNRDL